MMTGVVTKSLKNLQRQVLTDLLGAQEVAKRVSAEKSVTHMYDVFVPKFKSLIFFILFVCIQTCNMMAKFQMHKNYWAPSRFLVVQICKSHSRNARRWFEKI